MVRQLLAAMRHPAPTRQFADSSFGQRAEGKLAKYSGSRMFLTGQSRIPAARAALKVIAAIRHWDPLIASNRQEERDRLLERLVRQNTQPTEKVHSLSEESRGQILQAAR